MDTVISAQRSFLLLQWQQKFWSASTVSMHKSTQLIYSKMDSITPRRYAATSYVYFDSNRDNLCCYLFKLFADCYRTSVASTDSATLLLPIFRESIFGVHRLCRCFLIAIEIISVAIFSSCSGKDSATLNDFGKIP